MGLDNLAVGMNCDEKTFGHVAFFFPDFFEETETGYTLVKEPTQELIKFCKEEIEVQQISQEKDYDSFERKVAEHIAKGLSNEDKATILKNPNYSRYHFGFGMYIRNRYIHGRELRAQMESRFIKMADDISAGVFHDLVKILQDEKK